MTRPEASGTALFLSPHLDDAVFSAGATMACLVDRGWRVVMATAFTRSVPDPTGFALDCQTSKGLAPEVDYMALRRAEDEAAAAIVGVEPRWLGLPEAPHRGYDSAPALFAQPRADDAVWQPLAALIAGLLAELRPALVATCQGLGAHVDHRQVIRAVPAECPPGQVAFWRDTPYVIRQPEARRDSALPAGTSVPAAVMQGLGRKIAASQAYTSQVGFQFGGPEACASALRDLAEQEGGERFMGRVPLELPAWA